MTKNEIIDRIIDRITDPWNESPDDYKYAIPITLAEAEGYLAEYRKEDLYFDPEDRMPEEATPALLMEAYNTHIQRMKEGNR